MFTYTCIHGVPRYIFTLRVIQNTEVTTQPPPTPPHPRYHNLHSAQSHCRNKAAMAGSLYPARQLLLTSPSAVLLLCLCHTASSQLLSAGHSSSSLSVPAIGSITDLPITPWPVPYGSCLSVCLCDLTAVAVGTLNVVTVHP